MGASVQNLFNTFTWDTSKLVSQSVAGSIDNGTVELDLDLADITSGGGDPYYDAGSRDPGSGSPTSPSSRPCGQAPRTTFSTN